MGSNSIVVGILRALLTADTAQFTSGMRQAADSAKAFERDWKKVGQQATQVGTALTKTITLPLVALGGTAAKAAMDFESSFAGVRKTVNATEAEFTVMAQGFRDLAKTIPVNVNELNRLGEAAGALGIPKAEVVDFARVMALLGVTTNVTSDQAAESIAKIQNIFGAAGKDTERFASTLVALGNDGASTEDQILSMATRIAGAGNAIGISQGQVLAFASALSSVGIEAEMGGSAISRVFIDIAGEVNKGGSDLAKFAATAGLSVGAFSKLFKEDAAQAVNAFIVGLGGIKKSGGDLLGTLAELGFTEIRVRDTLLRAAGAGDLLTRALHLQKTAWTENNALSKEAAERFKTTESQLALLWNRVKDVGITLGNALLPTIKAAIGAFDTLIPLIDSAAKLFAGMPQPVQAVAIGLGAVAAAAGPVLFVFGQIAISAAAVAGAFAAKGIAATALTAAYGRLAIAATTAWAAILGPVGVAIAAIAGIKILADQLRVASGLTDQELRDLAGTSALTATQLNKLAADALPETTVELKKLGGASAVAGRDLDHLAFGVIPNLLSMLDQAHGGLKSFVERIRQDVSDRAIRPITAGVALFNAELERLSGVASAAGKSMPLFTAELAATRRAVADLTEDQKANIRAGIEMGIGAEKIAERLGVSKAVVELYADAVKNSAAETRKAETATKAWTETVRVASAGMALNLARWAALPAAIHDAKAKIDAVRGSIAGATQNLDAMNLMMQATAVVPTQFMRGNLTAADRYAVTLGATVRGSLTDALSSMPQVVMGALQGGGDVGRSVGSLFGGSIAGALSGSLSKAIGGTLGKMAGGIMGPLGSIAGSFIGTGISKLFGSLFGGGEKKKVQDALGKMLQEAGGKDAFVDLAKSAGVSDELLSKLFNAKKLRDYEHALRQITGQMEAHNQELRNAQLLTDAQAQRQELLNAAIGRQKFAIEELGPALQRQNLAERAEQILDDWKLLTEAGIDVKAVTREMADEMSAFVNDARRTGTEVPDAMRPIIQSMIDQGLLLDDNGDAFRDLESTGLTFGRTLTDMFRGVLEKLDLLIQRLDEAARPRRGSVTIDETVNVTRRDITPGAPGENTGGRAQDAGADSAAEDLPEPQSFHRGGLVLPRFHNGGMVGAGWSIPRLGAQDVPAILQTGERVLNRSEAAAYGGFPPDVRQSLLQLHHFMTSSTGFERAIQNAVHAALIYSRP